MIRASFNLAMAVGYFLGVVLVWIGIEMYAIDGARLSPSLISVFSGILMWAMLASLGRIMRAGSVVSQTGGCES